MTAKRILTGVLTAAMVVTSVNLPGMISSVQAATVYNDTTTALSSLAGSTGLKIYRLTSDDAGKELTSGIYYVDEDLTFTGADSTSSSQAGGNGLKIADGATVYIYIADGKTLTATGGNGYAATAGASGEDGSFTFSSGTYSGVTFNVRNKPTTQGKGKAGGNGASGGGAGIYVPQNANFAVMGQGKLNATGGDGGNAQIGGQGGKTNYYYVSFEVYSGKTSPAYSQVLKSLNDYPDLSITGAPSSNTAITMAGSGATGAGGSGGGGAGGGGAAVGSNGANGSTGGQGGATSTRETIGNGSTASTVSSGTSGKIYIQGVDVSSCAAGAGGSTTSQQYSAKANTTLDYKDYYDTKGVNGKYLSMKFYITEGQAGGVGGAGGNGAVFGNGGSGGAGGTGGNSGSFRDSYDKYTSCAGDAKVGADGASGASGTGANQNLGDTQYPYNTITFTNLASANTQYYITKSGTFTAPDYSVGENQTFVGWKVTTPAVALPKAFGETASEVLTTADEIIPAGTEVSTAGIYGNITLEPFVINHTHNWIYETDSTDSSKVYAWCTEEENSKYCPYHGEEQKLTLSLKADGKTYDGNAYNSATVDDAITAVTKATAGSVTYYEADSDGNKTGSAIAAPVNAGKYVAEVTVSDGSKSVSAIKTFEIERAEQTAIVSMAGYEYGKTVSTPDITGAKENPDVTYYYSTEDKNTAGTEWKDIKNDTLEPGTYYMYAVLARTDNYKTYTTAPVSFTVQGSDMSGVTAANVTKTYDGNSYGITVNTGSIPNAVVTYGTEAGTYDLTECPAYKNVGTYTIYYKVNARGYNSFTGSATVTINPKKVTATVTAKNKTYDGNTDATVSAEVSSDDLISGDSIAINGITGTFEDQNAGTDKKITVDSSKKEITGTGVDNYDITIGTEATASINKLTAKFQWSNTDLTYTGSEQSVTAEVSNAVSGDKFTLTYEGNKQTAVGSYTAKVTALGNDNYELPSEENAKTAWKISYLAKGTAEVSGTKGDNDWYVTKVTITPEAGYEISANGTDWKAFLEYDAQGSQTAAYYLRETATGFVSDKKTAEFKIDTELPTGEIKIKDNGFTGFLNTITFKHFFKKTVDVKITGTDTTSGIAKIEYQKVAKGASFDKDGTWTEGRSFSMTANDKSAIYARITDNAGNSAIINSDGIVVYTDATATAEETFTKTSTADITTGITVNGNTIASVKNGSDTVAESAYEIKEDKLVLKASYLQTLAAGKYTLTVSYNPYGESYTADSKGDAPDTSVITLTVKKAAGSISDVSDISKVYDGNAVNAPTFTTTNDRGTDDVNVTVEYKKQGADDSTYTSEAPQDYGKYVVRITVKSDDDYETVVTTKEFSIHKKEMQVSADGYTGTYDGQAYGITVSVTDPADNAASNVKVVYGTKNADGKITYSENPVTYKDAGEYTVYYKVTADNYEDAEGSAVIKIAPKTVSLVWSGTEFTYNGKAHKPSANVSEKDIIGSDSVEVTVAGEQINAGSYTAQAVALSNSNYTLGADVSTAFVIKKAAATVTVDNATKHIGKNDPKFTYKVTGLVEGESLKDITVARAEGETAGSYDITATAKDGTNANYDVTFVTGKLTIEDHTAVVDKAVAATCTETGLTEGSHCSVCNEVLVAQTVVDALGHDWSEWVKVGNREKSTCSRCGQVKYRNIETADTGNLEKDAEVAPGSPITEATLDNDKSELITASGIFTAEEKTAIENGADARVWLEISATAHIADTDKQKVEAEAKKIMGRDISKVVYFDADLFKSVTKDGTTTKAQIKEPGTEIEVSVSLPESLVQADSTISRAYKIIRLHNGEVDSFEAAFDKETGTLTFKTDRFSTYAIAFTDTQLVTGITLTPDSKTLTKKGETVQLTATVTPDNAADKKVTWTSSDSKVATVDENGLVTAVANGTAIITVTTEDGGKTATAKITVNISSDDDNNGDNGNNNNDNKDNSGSNGGSNNNPATTPDNKNNGADTKKDNQSVTSPQTGDTSNQALWTTLFMASLAGLVSLLVKRRKGNCK